MNIISENKNRMAKPILLILLNWNTKKHAEQCILSLKAHADEKLFDIILADNGSTDDSLFYLRNKFPELIFLDNKENLGFAEGNNRAITLGMEMGYSYSLLLNTDTLIIDDLVSQLYYYLREREQVAAVQPAIYYLHKPNKIWNGVMNFNLFFGVSYSAASLPGIPKNVDWITGCCCLIRNDVLKKTGTFNKQFFLYYEDVELSYRIKEYGYELHFLPGTKLLHEAGVSGQLANKTKEGTLHPIIHYYLIRNRIWFLRKNGNKLFLPVNTLVLFVYCNAVLAYFIIRSKKQKTAYFIKGIKDGIFTPSKTIWSN